MLKPLLERYGRWITPALLLGGFLKDILTYRTLGLSEFFLLNGAYVCAAAAGLIIGERGSGRWSKYVPLAVQFAFGGLLCNALLFYWFGGTVAASWPVMLVTVALVASNERFREAFLRPTAQFGVFAFTFFSYCTMLLPYLLRSISVWAFLAGTVAATAGSLLVVEAISRTDAKRRPLTGRLRTLAGGVTASFLALYFLNVIPPIPLSIRDAGIYHDVKSSGGQYQLIGEDENIFQKMWPGQSLHLEQGGDNRIYAYTAIFAPDELSTRVAHRWQRYDETSAAWVDAGPASSYTTRGGRDGGFRGYSYRTITKPGKWRVIVESERGQELGRLGFTIVE